MTEFNQIFVQKMVEFVKNMSITSASPFKTNYVKDTNEVGFGSDFNQAFEAAVIESVEEYLAQNPPESTDKQITKTGSGTKKSKNELLSAAQAGADPVDYLQAYAKRLVPVLLPILIAAGIADIIIKTTLSPGGILDRRLRVVITETVNGILDQQTKKNFSIGMRQVSIQSRAGFRSIQGIGSDDNLRQIKFGLGNGLRKSTLDYVDFSKGVRELKE